MVLVAAHNELVRACLCNAIRGIGGQPIAATTREQALAILETENQPLDAVLVDRRLPGADRLYTVAAQLPHREGMRVCEVLPCDRLSENSFGAATGLVLLPVRRGQILDALTGGDPCLLPTPQTVDEDDAAKVLVVEDDEINREVCCTMLARLGFRNEGVANGREAVHAVLHERYDFVLMDLVMPVMDGIRATSTICDLVPEDRRPVIIALSASTSAVDRDLCRSAGMADFLDKPLYKDDLGEILERWKRARHQRIDGGAGDG